MKAADIPDSTIYEFIIEQNNFACWTFLADRLPEFPPKVVHAKFAQMANKNRIGGCPCGCRGDFRLETARHCDLASKALGHTPITLQRGGKLVVGPSIAQRNRAGTEQP